MNVKSLADRAINGVLLKPFGLSLKYRVGAEPVDDLRALLLNEKVDIVVDGGAHRGSFSRRMSKIYPRANIHAFEPTPASHLELLGNTRYCGNVTCHEVALGSVEGTAQFHTNESPLTNSLRKSSSAGAANFGNLVRGKGEIEVKVTTLDTFARANNIEKIDVMKLDLQGSERDALVGAGGLLSRLGAALVEVQFVALYDGAPLFCDINEIMKRHGLSLFQFYEMVRSPDDGRLLYGDALFVRDRLLNHCR